MAERWTSSFDLFVRKYAIANRTSNHSHHMQSSSIVFICTSALSAEYKVLLVIVGNDV